MNDGFVLWPKNANIDVMLITNQIYFNITLQLINVK